MNQKISKLYFNNNNKKNLFNFILKKEIEFTTKYY